MKPLARKLYTEPTAFIAAIVAVLQVVQVLTVGDPTVSAIVGALLVVAGGAATRARVTPAGKAGAS